MPNTSKIKGRMKTIASTQKITKAMKLVSLSKLQQYRSRMASFDVYYDALAQANQSFIEFTHNDSDQDTIYLVFMPDLGLCSSYTNGMLKYLKPLLKSNDLVLSVGTQHYELFKNQGLNIVNELLSSEKFDLEDIVMRISEYTKSHKIVAVVPSYRGVTLSFNLEALETQAKQGRDDAIYDPSFEEASQKLIDLALIALVQNTFFQSKVSEHTTRRIAMEKATDSAQEMLDDLGREYNRIRQEAITQEIAEIVSGMEGV